MLLVSGGYQIRALVMIASQVGDWLAYVFQFYNVHLPMILHCASKDLVLSRVPMVSKDV